MLGEGITVETRLTLRRSGHLQVDPEALTLFKAITTALSPRT